MNTLQRIASVLVAVALSVTFVAAGLAVCVLPPLTRGLAGAYATEDLSPFGREQLVRAADAERDFSFGSHDALALYGTVYAINAEYRDEALAAGRVLPAGFPRLDVVQDASNLDQLRAAFAGASEQFCLSGDAVSHLDDCYAVFSRAVPVLVAVAAIAIVGLVWIGRSCGAHALGSVLLGAGAVVVLVFATFGVWALVDFFGFFTVFHQLLFSQGNWQFAYDSLLICSLPTEFWMGMGVAWLATTLVASVASVVVGLILRRRSSQRRTQGNHQPMHLLR